MLRVSSWTEKKQFHPSETHYVYKHTLMYMYVYIYTHRLKTHKTTSYSGSGSKMQCRKCCALSLLLVISGISQYRTPSATFIRVVRSFSPKNGQCPVRLSKQQQTNAVTALQVNHLHQMTSHPHIFIYGRHS